jgi:integrase
MRGADLDTTSKLWVYRPRRHKNQFRGKDRIVYLGPRAQGILRAFLKTDLSAPIFSPAEAEAERRANVHNHRKTPMNQGNKPGTNRRRRPIHKPGSAYTTGSYLVAIYRGCDRAFPPPPEIAADSAELVHWRKEHRFHPNQLRHTAGTSLRTEYGLETAGAILGHSRLETSQIYCETNANLAKAAMTTVG